MNRRVQWALLLATSLWAPQALAQDAYAAMLGWLTDSRIDGQALSGAQGAIKLNQAAGDLNAQLNAHALARGQNALSQVDATATQSGNAYRSPADGQARATLAGSALAGASGLASINQASGQANGQANLVGLSQGQGQGSPQLAAPRSSPLPASAARGRAALLRHAAVEADALRGFSGVLQLNQIAGSSNVVENRLGLHVQTGP